MRNTMILSSSSADRIVGNEPATVYRYKGEFAHEIAQKETD